MAEYIESMKPIIEQIVTDICTKEENHIMKAVYDVGIVVDKFRLSQALTDATTFYKEGYRAAMGRSDVVEVVHCGDCKQYAINFSERHKCKQFNVSMPKNGFCSHGERKEGAE